MCASVTEAFCQSGSAMTDPAATQLELLYTHYTTAYVSLILQMFVHLSGKIENGTLIKTIFGGKQCTKHKA